MLKEAHFLKYPAKLKRSRRLDFEIPDLIAIQKDSYQRFWEKGLRDLLNEISPIKDWADQELELYFLDYHLDEPKYNEMEAKDHNVSYEAPLYCRVKIVNKKTKEAQEQDIFLQTNQ